MPKTNDEPKDQGKKKHFENSRAWQAARHLVNLTYKNTNSVKIPDQSLLYTALRQTAGQAMHSIAEGFKTDSDAAFIRQLKTGLRTTTKFQSQLYVALDQNYFSDLEFEILYDQAEETTNQIKLLIEYILKKKK
jgi:four helix bundle protein